LFAPFERLRSRIKASLEVERLPLDSWRDSEGQLTPEQQRAHRLRLAVVHTVRASRRLLGLPLAIMRAPYHWLELTAELERLHFSQWRRVRRGRGCVVDRQTWWINGHNVTLGNFVKISAFSSVMAGARASISIGSNTIVGPGCTIVAINHGFATTGVPIRYQAWRDTLETSIVIEDDVWLGANVVVLPGTRIGRGAVIGAGAIVDGDVAPETVVAPVREQWSRSRP
jgi:acetyltransferase-like isoleucine patch superfamily enzyme